MTAEGWKSLILDAITKMTAGDDEQLNRLARHLEMCDEAKQVLRDAGYGWTGLDILETARLVGEPASWAD